MAIAYGARVGSGHANTNGVTQTVTTSANVPAGSTILVSVSASNVGDTSNLTSVTDSAGNTYASGAFTCDAGQNTLTAVWYSTTGNALASASTVTVTFHTALLSSGESWEIAVDYLTGAATTTPTDGTNGKNGQTTASWVTNSITTTNAADLVWIAAGTNQGAPLAITNAASTPTTGWTTLATVSAGAGNNNQLATGYQVFSATGAYQGGGSVTAFNNGTSAVIIAFKAASGGGGTALTASPALAKAITTTATLSIALALSSSPTAALATTQNATLSIAVALTASPALAIATTSNAALSTAVALSASPAVAVAVTAPATLSVAVALVSSPVLALATTQNATLAPGGGALTAQPAVALAVTTTATLSIAVALSASPALATAVTQNASLLLAVALTAQAALAVAITQNAILSDASAAATRPTARSIAVDAAVTARAITNAAAGIPTALSAAVVSSGIPTARSIVV